MTTVYYAAPSTRSGAQLALASCEGVHTEPTTTQTMPVVVIDGTAYSDYSGTAVERSNYRVILSDQAAAAHVVCLYGAYGTAALAYIPTDRATPCRVPEPVAEYLAHIADYHVIDDDDHCRLESDMIREAWDDYGRRDFAHALARRLREADPAVDYDLATCEPSVATAVDTMWRDYSERYGQEPVIEDGGKVYFPDDVTLIPYRDLVAWYHGIGGDRE